MRRSENTETYSERVRRQQYMQHFFAACLSFVRTCLVRFLQHTVVAKSDIMLVLSVLCTFNSSCVPLTRTLRTIDRAQLMQHGPHFPTLLCSGGGKPVPGAKKGLRNSFAGRSISISMQSPNAGNIPPYTINTTVQCCDIAMLPVLTMS